METAVRFNTSLSGGWSHYTSKRGLHSISRGKNTSKSLRAISCIEWLHVALWMVSTVIRYLKRIRMLRTISYQSGLEKSWFLKSKIRFFLFKSDFYDFQVIFQSFLTHTFTRAVDEQLRMIYGRMLCKLENCKIVCLGYLSLWHSIII